MQEAFTGYVVEREESVKMIDTTSQSQPAVNIKESKRTGEVSSWTQTEPSTNSFQPTHQKVTDEANGAQYSSEQDPATNKPPRKSISKFKAQRQQYMK